MTQTRDERPHSRASNSGYWPPYVFYPSERERGRRYPEIVKVAPADGFDWFEAVAAGSVSVVEVWTFDAVIRNFLASIAPMFLYAETLKKVSDDDVRNWLALTRRLARDLPYGGPLRDQMHGAVATLERLRGGFSRHLNPGFPMKGMRHEAAVRLNSLLFACERIIRTAQRLEPQWAMRRAAEGGLDGLEYLRVDLAGVWERWLGPLGVDPASCSDDAVRKRLDRFRRNVRPGHVDTLTRDVLADVLTHGPFFPDGAMRHRPAESPQ